MLNQNQGKKSGEQVRYTVKEVAELLSLSPHTIRYYENLGLIPFVNRNRSNARIFSERDILWFREVNCLRDSGLPIEKIRHYVSLCLKGEETLAERVEILSRQRECLERRILLLREECDQLRKREDSCREALPEKGSASLACNGECPLPTESDR